MAVKLMQVEWKNLKIRDVILNQKAYGVPFEGMETMQHVVDKCPELPVVIDIMDWRKAYCYEIITENGSLIASYDHLICVNGGPYDDFELTKVSKIDGKHFENECIACQDIWNYLAMENPDAIIEGVNGQFKIRPYKALEEQNCRCITVSGGEFSINNVLSKNTARGAHSLDSMKDIVYNLINVAGMSEEWVAQNLYLDIESIKRMQQLSGLKAAMNDIDDCDMAWSPEKDSSYQRKMVAYLVREAANFIELYRKDHPDDEIQSNGTAVDIALSIGFDQTDVWKKHGEVYMQYV